MNITTDYLTLDSLRFEQVESESISSVNYLQNLLDTFHSSKLTGDVKIAYDAYWQNEIATMEM